MAKEVKEKLSRADMEEVIKGGGSVMVDGQIITSVKDLPDDEESIAAAEAEVEARKTKAKEKVTADLESMTKAELLALADKRGVEVKSSATKGDIIEAIQGA